MALKSLFSTFSSPFSRPGAVVLPRPAAAPEEPEALSVTRWTEKTELFAEYPPLAVGSTSRFAIHLTRLDWLQGADRRHTWRFGSKAARRNRKCFASTHRLARAFSAST